MPTYLEVLAQIEKLQREAATLKEKEVQEVINRIKSAIAIYQLTPQDLGFAEPDIVLSSGRRQGSVVKYADGQGNVWSGRGPRPKWFKKAMASGVDPESLKLR